MADGSTKAIQDIHEGDLVWADDPENEQGASVHRVNEVQENYTFRTLCLWVGSIIAMTRPQPDRGSRDRQIHVDEVPVSQENRMAYARIQMRSVPGRLLIVACVTVAIFLTSVSGRGGPLVLKDDRVPGAICAKDLSLYVRWLHLSPAQENVVGLSFVTYEEQLESLRSRIATFQAERMGETTPREMLAVVRKARSVQHSIRAQMIAADNAFFAECEAVLAKPQLPAMEMVRDHRSRTAAMGTRILTITGRPFVDLTDLAHSLGLLTDDVPEIVALLGDYERQLATEFKRLEPLAERQFENVIERVCSDGHGDDMTGAGFEAAKRAWNDVNRGLLDVGERIDELTEHTAIQIQGVLPARVADEWREAWITRWEPMTSEVYRLHHVASDVIKSSEIPLHDDQLEIMREQREQAIATILKLNNPQFRRHSPYEADAAGLKNFDDSHETSYRNYRSGVFQWAKQFDSEPAAGNDAGNEGMVVKIEAALRNETRNLNSSIPVLPNSAVYEPLTIEDLGRCARECSVEAESLSPFSEILATYRMEVAESLKKASGLGEPDRFVAVQIWERCEDKVFDRFAEVVPAEKKICFEVARQCRARSLYRKNSRAHFGMSRVDLGAVLRSTCGTKRDLSQQELEQLLKYHTKIWPALQEWAEASAKFYSSADGAPVPAEGLRAIFERLHNAVVAVDQLNSQMLIELLSIVPEPEGSSLRNTILEASYAEVLLDKGDARPAIAAAKKLEETDSDVLQRIMELALVYEGEYATLNDKMVAALAGVVEWRTHPTNPGPICRNCETEYQMLHQRRAELSSRTLIKLKAVLPQQSWLRLRESGDLAASPL